MGRNHFSKLARKILAVGLVSCFPGCGSFELASPKPQMGWSRDGLKDRITPSQQADVQIAMGRTAEHEGDIGSAEVAYREALKRDKKRGDAHLHLANIQTLKGEYRQAEEEYQRALEASPGNADVFCDMGYSYYLQRKWEDAQRNLKQALAIDPNHARAHNNLALVYAHMERTEDALAEFQRAGNSAAVAHVNLAFSLSLDKRWQLAREEYGRAMAFHPSSDVLKARLHEIDRLIAANDVQTPKRAATKDARTIPVSTSASLPVPQGNLAAKAEKAARPPIQPPIPLCPSSW
jgi:tetratricopeptide (TPR) repeat protein